MSEILAQRLIRIFVYGTLRQGQRLSFYMQGSKFEGMYYAQGQLMKDEDGNVYIDKREKGVATIGELHYISYFSLKRINHVEATSSEFPQGYELHIMPVWRLRTRGEYDFDLSKAIYAFYFRRKNTPVKILTGDYATDFDPIEELEDFLLANSYRDLRPDQVLQYMQKKMSIWEFEY
jgi:gamma-glutamylcyclotransferase (GGCT)/AIG2-like uncharacterized protein YtfP